MARSFNQFNCMGNLAADPETRDLNNAGRQVCKLRVMINDSYKDRDGNTKDESFGIDINVFGEQQIKYLMEYGRKGDRVLVSDGKLKVRKYQRQDGGDAWATEINVGPYGGNVSIETSRAEREARENRDGGGRGRDDDRGGRGRDDRDDRGGRGRDDDRGGSRGRDDDRGGRGRDDDRGGSRGRDDDRGGRGGSGGGRGSFNDLDDDVPF